ncbi:hypothetical protein LGH70_19325 [Hymenobacter sp. BT635]|uniref:Uncharacterized protein n=1 Tax=Hymenobacter nitidus TaxID=2880929 RepID=A0ABS8AHL8_9BACT|nr:hypothetical protein [Hymenobacter nitidus]MCB2379756.1 hypothetical protein [Hymenobacter nitidus]
MTTVLLLALLTFGIFTAAYLHRIKSRAQLPMAAVPVQPLPTGPNDKLLIVDNVAHAQLETVLRHFCALYNAAQVQIRLKLVNLSASRFAIVFPTNISFGNFCFLVNYLQYPTDQTWDARLFAWDTLQADNDWFTADYVGTRVILFVPPDDKEYDNICVTTQDNRGFKLGFGGAPKAQSLHTPKELYAEAPVSVAALLAAEGQYIQ